MLFNKKQLKYGCKLVNKPMENNGYFIRNLHFLANGEFIHFFHLNRQ